jgi:23S rRNA (adenine-N6)-dimethyltransferase
MSNRSIHGGRHELGQNFLIHQPTIETIISLVAKTDGPILEIGAGDGALTVPLATLGRPLRAIDIDEHHVARLRRRLASVDIEAKDALREALDRPVIVGCLPFHITTPLLRRLLEAPAWKDAIVLTQWEVARKRAGIGGSTMMTAQAGPWFTFLLHGRVPAHGFVPPPSVDGGVLAIRRRDTPLVRSGDRSRYERFVRGVFTGRGRGIANILRLRVAGDLGTVKRALDRSSVDHNALPRDLTAGQWAALWNALGAKPASAPQHRRKGSP